MTKSVFEYVIADRQWKREHRIAHAKMMLAKAKPGEEKHFWREVLEANRD